MLSEGEGTCFRAQLRSDNPSSHSIYIVVQGHTYIDIVFQLAVCVQGPSLHHIYFIYVVSCLTEPSPNPLPKTLRWLQKVPKKKAQAVISKICPLFSLSPIPYPALACFFPFVKISNI